jgi:hypothetical protein
LELLGPGEAAAHIAPAIVRKWYLSLSSIAVNSDLRIQPSSEKSSMDMTKNGQIMCFQSLDLKVGGRCDYSFAGKRAAGERTRPNESFCPGGISPRLETRSLYVRTQ